MAEGGSPAKLMVVGEMVEYRPGQWLRAGAVVAAEKAEPPPGGAGGDFGDFGDEPTRLLVAGAAVTGKAGSADWWRCPYPLEAVLAALAEALQFARGGVAAGSR
jgi:hypothetical protein